MASLRSIWLLAALCGYAGPPVYATAPWPAESNVEAVRLTGLDAGLDGSNWSGATWNPETRTLWLACNSGYFWALAEDGSGHFQVATNAAGTPAKWTPGGDLEGICQADFGANLVYLMDENGYIREYDVSQPGVVVENRHWDIRAICPEVGSVYGPEGLAFVPNEWLRRQRFCRPDGTEFASTNGMGGLMLVGYQYDGFVYALDLNRATGTFGFIGKYQTGQTETADLEFDRATGTLYVWHNVGSNYLEAVELSSVANGANRRLRQLAEYYGPCAGNLEGFALAPAADGKFPGGCILTDDDNQDHAAVAWYGHFQPAADTDRDGLADGWELWHFGPTTQTVGAIDWDFDRMSNADEEKAGTEPTNGASVLILGEPSPNGPELALNWQSATGKFYRLQSATRPEFGFTCVVASNVAATAPLNVVTVKVAGLPGNAFFWIAVEPPD